MRNVGINVGQAVEQFPPGTVAAQLFAQLALVNHADNPADA